MQNTKLTFTENEQHIGYIETDSGTLLLADGIWANAMPTVDQQALLIDTEVERAKFPVYSVTRGGQRFLLIALDTDVVNNRITNEDDRVEVDEPLNEDELSQREGEEQ